LNQAVTRVPWARVTAGNSFTGEYDGSSYPGQTVSISIIVE